MGKLGYVEEYRTARATAARMQAEPATRPFRVDGDVYALSDYPATERMLREGGVLVVATDDPFGDPSEQAHMRRDGHAQLLAVGVKTAATMKTRVATRFWSPCSSIDGGR